MFGAKPIRINELGGYVVRTDSTTGSFFQNKSDVLLVDGGPEPLIVIGPREPGRYGLHHPYFVGVKPERVEVEPAPLAINQWNAHVESAAIDLHLIDVRAHEIGKGAVACGSLVIDRLGCIREKRQWNTEQHRQTDSARYDPVPKLFRPPHGLPRQYEIGIAQAAVNREARNLIDRDWTPRHGLDDGVGENKTSFRSIIAVLKFHGVAVEQAADRRYVVAKLDHQQAGLVDEHLAPGK